MEKALSKESDQNLIVPIRTEMVLCKERNLRGDCGPLCVLMILLTEFPEEAGNVKLESLKKDLDKVDDEGTMPGNICKLFMERGFNVVFFSTIDWESLLEPEDVWDSKIRYFLRSLDKKTDGDGLVDKNKLIASARWLIKNKDIVLNKKISLKDLEIALRNGMKIIALVGGGKHYVVVTGIDEKMVYFNNPTSNPAKEEMTHTEFMKWWSLSKNIQTSETIFIKRISG